jgi:hypothetical protein
MRLKAIYFASLLFAGLALAPAMAHLLELPNKIDLTGEDYLVVQRNYRGWALLGVVVVAALLSTLALTIMLRIRGGPFALASPPFCASPARRWFSGRTRFRPTGRRTTGLSCQRTGTRCARSGNTLTP